MTLKQGNSNTSYQVVSIQLEEKLERRLEALGLTEGSTITIMNNQKKGSLTVKFRAVDHTFTPAITEEERKKRLKGWNKAVRYAFDWARDEE